MFYFFFLMLSLFFEFAIILFLFLCFGFWAARHVGSQLPDQGSNLCPLHWKHSLNHWTIREVLRARTSSIFSVLYSSVPTHCAINPTWIYQMIIFKKNVVVVLQSLSCVRHICYPVDCSLPGSSVHGISQARILEQVAISYSRGSFQLRDQIALAGGFFTTETPGKPLRRIHLLKCVFVFRC